MTLYQLESGQSGVIRGYIGDDPTITNRLIEMGFVVGETVTLSKTGLLGKDPLAFLVRGALIGIGRREASLIEIERN